MELLKILESFFAVVFYIGATAGILLAFFQYRRQRVFERMKNLTQLWERFAEKEHLAEIFALLDNPTVENQKKLKDASLIADKLRYLALLDEVTLFAWLDEVDKEKACYLFQFHFYNCIWGKGGEAFWEYQGGLKEVEKPYWKDFLHFAQECRGYMIREGTFKE